MKMVTAHPAPDASDIEQRGINVIRGLAMDGPQRANSGHPGTAMALAPLTHVLWTRILRHDPSTPDWPDRDRFILSAGHASILLYSMLYLTGYELTLQDLREFRSWGSRTPGHPEVHRAPGVEVTSGPLGQGFANGVGMGIAERFLRARFGAEVCDHHTFIVCSDGDLMEGISHEAASLAGHLGLGRLVYVFDDNHITIDGATELTVSDDTGKRFESYGWHVQRIGEAANDLATLEDALLEAKSVEDRPSLIILRSHIGWPSPSYTDSERAHGSPLGDEEVRRTKEILGHPPDETFWVPEDVLAMYRRCVPRGQSLRRKWEDRMRTWDGDRAAYDACLVGRGLPGWSERLPVYEPGDRVATREASGRCLNALAEVVPGLLPGSPDLTGIALGSVSHWWIGALLLVVEYFAVVVWNVVTVSLRQSIIPDHLLGRVNSVYRFFGWGMMPLGALVGGLIVEIADGPMSREVSLRLPHWIAAAGTLLLLALFATTRLTTEAADAARAETAAERGGEPESEPAPA